MEAIPRTTRAQAMDALSSQAVVAGYRATLAAARRARQVHADADHRRRDGKPRRVLVLGAGVAGLQAIATAKRLGAVVEAYDVRPAVKEEVESLGAKFVQIEVQQEGEGSGSGEYAKEVSADVQRRQQELLADRVAAADIVVTTAAVPGRPGAEARRRRTWCSAMRPGSVIVDMAAETGGNCELTEPGAGRGEGRRHDRRHAQPAQPDAVPRQPSVREQRREPAQAPRAGGRSSRSTSRTRSRPAP